jgi:uncharacterized protein (TIGR02271 family)
MNEAGERRNEAQDAGVGGAGRGAGSARDQGRDAGAASGTQRDVETVRSEERLRVEALRVPVGRLRVGKRVVTEQRTVTVTVRREEFYLERLPVEAGTQAGAARFAEANASGSQTGAVLELVLCEEEPVITTRVVPRERVRVFLDRDTSSFDVTATLAREVVAVEEERPPR